MSFANEAARLISDFWNLQDSIIIKYNYRDLSDETVREELERILRKELSLFAKKFVTKDFKLVVPADKVVAIGRKGFVDSMLANYFAYNLQGQFHLLGNLTHEHVCDNEIALQGSMWVLGRSWTGIPPVINATTITTQLTSHTDYVVRKECDELKLSFINTDFRSLQVFGPVADFNPAPVLNRPLNPSIKCLPEGYALFDGCRLNPDHYPRPRLDPTIPQ